jgi:hypothetical protein
VARDEIEDEVVPGRGRTGHHELLTVTRRDERLFEAEANVRKVLTESRRVRRMHRRVAAGEETRLGDEQHAGAGRAEHRAVVVKALQPRDELGVATRPPDAVGDED